MYDTVPGAINFIVDRFKSLPFVTKITTHGQSIVLSAVMGLFFYFFQGVFICVH